MAPDAYDLKQDIGVVMQNVAVFDELTVQENIDYFCGLYVPDKKRKKELVEEAILFTGLEDYRKFYPKKLSGGLLRRLNIACGIAHKPKLIFLDEPTAGLDPVAAAALLDELDQLVHQQGVTVFLTTHNLGEAEKMCERVAVIHQGRLISIGSPDELRLRQGGGRLEIVGRGFAEGVLAALRQRPEVKAVSQENYHLVLELAGEVDTAPLVQFLVAHGVQIDEVRKGKASLEEVFLSLVKE
jgi:ABC-2 type transport system ATP-binding protein